MSEYVKELQEALGRERKQNLDLQARIKLLEERDRLRGELIAVLRQRISRYMKFMEDAKQETEKIKALLQQKGIMP